ncbi:MAG: hypothetical protein Q4615_13640, partial [Paracoccus aminovorans]|nr:hypothetical protein [Paracoccus aminovorans]
INPFQLRIAELKNGHTHVTAPETIFLELKNFAGSFGPLRTTTLKSISGQLSGLKARWDQMANGPGTSSCPCSSQKKRKPFGLG